MEEKETEENLNDFHEDCQDVPLGRIKILWYGFDRDPAVRLVQVEWRAKGAGTDERHPLAPADFGYATLPEWVLDALLSTPAAFQEAEKRLKAES